MPASLSLKQHPELRTKTVKTNRTTKVVYLCGDGRMVEEEMGKDFSVAGRVISQTQRIGKERLSGCPFVNIQARQSHYTSVKAVNLIYNNVNQTLT